MAEAIQRTRSQLADRSRRAVLDKDLVDPRTSVPQYP
uniref:Uncharacterized protein n=1 Tax=Oryza sativa subsp. japonica TaxID=39947 RepID=Q109B1_ORYSJ|nr:hypothetical protein LOC_Os10g39554 [Oryza sativa Japonica Group]